MMARSVGWVWWGEGHGGGAVVGGVHAGGAGALARVDVMR